MSRLFAAAAAGALVSSAVQAQTPPRENPADIILDSRLEVRIRRSGRPAGTGQRGDPAHARRLRDARTRRFQGSARVEDLRPILEDYNDGLNGMTRHPLVGDPEGAELNRRN
jgi:hypothetical protein